MFQKHLPAALLPVLCMLPAAAQDAAADARALANALNRFADDLHRELAANGPPTASPASIGIALAMLLPGARGSTADELNELLHLPAELRGDRLHAAFGKLLAGLGITGAPAADAPVLKITNDLWLQHGLPVDASYSRVLGASFAAGEHHVDFEHGAEAARTRINAAIAKATADRIPELVPPGLLTADTRLMLTNAIWLKGAWQHAFPERATRDAAFHLAEGAPAQVPTMHVPGTFAYAGNDEWQCVALPFTGGTLRCELVLPRPGSSLAAAERAMLAGEHLPALAETSVHVALPRFRVAAAHRLRDRLRALGLRAATGAGADFTGITPEEPLYIGDVVHQTWIQVDEAGAEAAAATAVMMLRSSAPAPRREEFTADRPFSFVLRDVRTGLVLFVARVEDPRRDAAKAPAGGSR